MRSWSCGLVVVVLALSATPNVGLAEPVPSLEALLLREGVAKLSDAVQKHGDARRGAVLFHQRHMACNRCHTTGSGKSLLGPDLAKSNPKITAAHVVESILIPSKVIHKDFQAVQVFKKDGRIVTGILQNNAKDAWTLLLPLETGKQVVIRKDDIDEVVLSRVSLMPGGQVNLLADRGQFLDLSRYVLEIAIRGPKAARELQPDPSPLNLVTKGPIDHAQQIAHLRSLDLNLGKELYAHYCLNCHGKDGNKTLNPLARRFGKDKLKFGADPYSMWKTISYGNGLMLPQAGVLSGEERYVLVNYLRETFIRDANPSQYHKPDDAFLAAVNERARSDAKQYGPVNPVIAKGMIDGSRGRQMEYGPYVAHSVAFETPRDHNAKRFPNTTERALVVRLPGDNSVCYDTERGSVTGIWSGGFVTTAKSHHQRYKGSMCLTPKGEVVYRNTDHRGWAIETGAVDDSVFTFKGHYLHSGQVLLEYNVAGRLVEELPGAIPGKPVLFSRTLRVGAGDKDLLCLVGRIPNSTAGIDGRHGMLVGKDVSLSASVTGGADHLKLSADDNGALWLTIPAKASEQVLSLWFSAGDKATGLKRMRIPQDLAVPDFEALKSGGPRHWPQVVRTAGVLGEPIEGYAADEITIPFANPWGSWMRTTAIDFFSDGSAAVSTLSGDVWIVRFSDSELSDITWRRFATGMYEPLGLRIVNDLVYVRGRDRITRLHDLNRDGEADYYENFHQEGEIGSNYHAFLFDLQTDRAGHFYYAKSGRKTPHKGGVVRVSPDGKHFNMVCHDFRHPNGMGFGGPHNWLTISDNPDGKAIYNGVAIVREGGYYGHQSPRTVPMLAVLPASVDSSSGGQCWTDDKHWGPLSGQLIHTSYSRNAMFYVLTQNLKPHPNGFAIRMPFAFKSGVMRCRVHPVNKQVYLVGQKGWDTQAKADGCLYRIRYVGGPTHLITAVEATKQGIRLLFSCDLDPKTVSKSSIEVVRDGKKAKPVVKIGEVVSIDSRTIQIALPEIEKETVGERSRNDEKTGRTLIDILAPLRITVQVKAADGSEIDQSVYATINSLPAE